MHRLARGRVLRHPPDTLPWHDRASPRSTSTAVHCALLGTSGPAALFYWPKDDPAVSQHLCDHCLIRRAPLGRGQQPTPQLHLQLLPFLPSRAELPRMGASRPPGHLPQWPQKLPASLISHGPQVHLLDSMQYLRQSSRTCPDAFRMAAQAPDAGFSATTAPSNLVLWQPLVWCPAGQDSTPFYGRTQLLPVTVCAISLHTFLILHY